MSRIPTEGATASISRTYLTRRLRTKGRSEPKVRRCRSPATKKGRCRLHGGQAVAAALLANGVGNTRHGERTQAAIAERQKFNALLKMLRAGLM
jgi:hypothetical protein